MALVIRLRKMGRTNHPTYRLVVIDKKKPRDGEYIEKVGSYNPFEKEDKNLCIQKERIEDWLKKGATFSEKAEALVRRVAPEIIKTKKKKNKKKKTKKS